MRPIELTISGINSFTDKQTIDFKLLLRDGFFGIFGKTGSGKTTVLDGITIALYGKTSRSSDCFINTNMDNAFVSYTFAMGEKIFAVERAYKRNKRGGADCKTARVVELNGPDKNPVAEGAKKVDETCREIIGLSYEDFIRTVVLPQGKFDEFLRLTDKNRSEMLERLFRLEKYGDELSKKLKDRRDTAEKDKEYIDGKLSGYENVSEEYMEEKRKEEKALAEETDRLLKEADRLKKLEEENEKLVKLFEILLKAEISYKELEAVKPRMEELRKKIELYKNIAPIGSLLKEKEDILSGLKLKEAKIAELLEEEKVILQKLSDENEKILILREKEEKELPRLIEKRQKLESICEDINKKDKLSEEKENLSRKIEEDSETKNKLSGDTEKTKKSLEELRSREAQLKKEESEADISPVYRKQIDDGSMLETALEALKREQENLGRKLSADEEIFKNLREDIKNREADLEALMKKAEDIKKDISAADEKYPNIEETLSNKKNYILEFRDKSKERSDLYKKLDGFKAIGKNLAENMAETNSRLTESEKFLKEKEEEYTRAVEENSALLITKNLKDGDICPVCGGVYHSGDHKAFTENDITAAKNALQKAKSDKAEAEKALNETVSHIEINKNDIKNIEDALAAYEKYGDFERVREIYKELYGEYETIKAEKERKDGLKADEENTKESLSSARIEYNNAIGNLSALEKNYNENKKLAEEKEAETAEKTAEYGLALEKISFKSFGEAKEDIISRDKKLKSIRDEKEELSEMKNKLENSLKEITEDIKAIDESIILNGGNLKNIADSIEELSAKIGDFKSADEVEKHIDEVKAEIENSKKELKIAEDNAEKLKNQKNENSLAITENRVNIEEAKKRLTAISNEFAGKTKDLPVKEENEIIVLLKDTFDIESESEKLSAFDSSMVIAAENLRKAKEDTAGKTRPAEAEKEIGEKLEAAKREAESKNSSLIELRAFIKNDEQRLAEKKELLGKQEKIQHLLDMILELTSLFKGKKFVLFVASKKLNSITRYATKTLKEISCDRYGIEVTEDGNFMIIDYRQGGIKRSPSTLSGGEVFIVSLALSLALSAQTTLSGGVNPYLFFLDEGFGTLDSSLLDDVIAALTRLPKKGRAIGLISHVDELKNRVPVKLNVEAAQMGQGSRVSIEIN